MLSKTAIFLALIFISFTCSSQDAYGIRYGVYAGLSSAQLNPSSIIQYANTWEFQIGGLQVFGKTNYAYVYDTGLIDLSENSDMVTQAFDQKTNPDKYDVIYNNSNKNKHLELRTQVMGPGFMISLNPYTKIGIATSLRGQGSIFGIDPILNHEQLAINIRNEEITIPKNTISGMLWQELSLHYATRWDEIDFGASLKINRPLQVGYVSNESDFVYNFDEDSNLIPSTDGTIKVAYSDFDENNPMETIGYGAALDLGWNFHGWFGQPINVGVAFLDIGYNQLDATQYTIEIDQGQIVNSLPYDGLETKDEFLERGELDGLQIENTEQISLFSPVALSLHIEYALSKKFTFHTSLINRLPIAQNQLRRSNILNATLAYDSKYFSAFLPVSLYEYQKLRIGGAVRMAFLTMGTDRLGSLFFEHQNFNSADFYLKLNLFQFWKKKARKKRKKNEKIKGSKVKCPKFDWE